MFSIPVFTVQVTKFVQSTLYITFSKIPPSKSMHFATRVARLYSVLYSEIAVSQKPFGIGHKYIYFFLLRMTATMASQNIVLFFLGHAVYVHHVKFCL
jgi:hypothetical protein